MRNIKLTIEYDGTNYSGWQYQTNGESIQGILEKALAKITAEKVSVKGASRTDAGVHALGQTANFRTNSDAPMSAFTEGLNSLLPGDILIKEAREENKSFDPIKSAVKKDYRYCIQRGQRSIITNRFSWFIRRDLKIELMKEAASRLLGEHDFKAFQASGSETKTSVRQMYKIEISDGPLGLLFIDLSASGFLKYMVRGVVGTLVDIGHEKYAPSRMDEIIESRDRKEAGPNAPPCGLFLVKVHY